MRNRKTLALGLVFLCLVCAVFGALLNPSDEDDESPAASATAIAAAAPTATPAPTHTPRPQATDTLTSPQCQRQINLYGQPSDSLQITDDALQPIGCVDAFDLYQPQPGRFNASMSLLINPRASREQVIQTLYNVNKNLFTSDLGVTCVEILAYPPGDKLIPGANQALGLDLAQQFADRWATASAQEWWDWLAANRTPTEGITGDCEKVHWAQWDDRDEYAPWK